MSFRHLDPPWPTILKATLLVVYVLMAAAGLFALILTPSSVEGAVGEALMTVAGVAALTGAAAAAAGVLIDWRLERVAVLGTIVASAAYAVAIWVLVGETPTRAMQAAWITATTGLFVYRALELEARAATDRAITAATRRAKRGERG